MSGIHFKEAGIYRNAIVKWGVLGGVALIFVALLYPSLAVKEYPYVIGDVAERNIKASKDFFIEDRDATEERRQKAVDAVLTVYDYDKQVITRATQGIPQGFALIEKVYTAAEGAEKAAAPSPKAPPAPKKNALPKPGGKKPAGVAAPEAAPSPDPQALQLKPDFEKAIGIPISDGEYKMLMQERFAPLISEPVLHIYRDVQGTGIVFDKELLLKDLDKGITLRTVQTKAEETVTALRTFYGLDQAKLMVSIVGDPLLKEHSPAQRTLIVAMVQKLLSPDITLNRNETEERRRQAEADIKPILYQIKAGEMILREGERVTPLHLKKLAAMQAVVHEDQVFAGGLGAVLILVCLMVSIYLVFPIRQESSDPDYYKYLLLAATILVILMVMAKLSLSLTETLALQGDFPGSAHAVYFGAPIAVGAMIICVFLGLKGAVGFAILACVASALLLQNRFELFAYYFLGSLLSAYWVQSCRERKVFIQAGAKLGFFNILIATAIGLHTGDLSVVHVLWNWTFAFLGGISAGIITLGVAPLIELGFGFTTDVSLLELSNLDQPILKKLMIDAPGTYHHSIIVGSLVEAAAGEIGANSLLAKVCAYYHDIGKINKPLYFVENQQDGKNRHDKLAPSMSSLILISHIKQGVETATKYKLGKPIIDAIRQHHGTSLIQYFYDRAKQQRGEDSVKIEDFRYPGPKPQTREAGLVMLADVVEAASRTLDNPTPARVQGLVQNLINKIFSDGQLDDCELTLKDLHNIAKSFNTILNGIHHHRIEYPDSSGPGSGKEKDGGSDRQSAKQEEGAPESDQTGGTGHLKRLGLS